MKQLLTPSLDDLRLECVLMQAWKKTSAYLRSHSWYADTLGLDYESLRLPKFIKEIQKRLQEPENWQSKPIELVPAPKNQRWAYQNEKWEPLDKNIDRNLRPLAHLDLQDQVVATAILLCLADRVETALGNPRLTVTKANNRRQVLAYGHRLLCDPNDDGALRHRWGSTKLYRQYSQDYQTFFERPKIVAQEIKGGNSDYEVAIVQSDFSKFYDRVRPKLLCEKLRKFKQGPEENDFFNLADRVFNWQWSNQRCAVQYAKEHHIEDFRRVALPQGLVTSGFFANIVLHDFDMALRSKLGAELPKSNLILKDVCYYVDDLRIVLQIPRGIKETDVKDHVITWLQDELNLHAPDLIVAKDKTEVTVEGREKRFLVMQSREANRIQRQVSDTFDMLHGTELIAAIEGFFQTQLRYTTEKYIDGKKDAGLLVGVPDMRDDTAARFAAGRFRRTFRSLRPLLRDEPKPSVTDIEDDEATLPQQLVLTKAQLDDRAKFFSAILIEEWIKNPGNVRLLRIALDLYPDYEYLTQVLDILRPGWESTSLRKAKREVRIYCLAELFRAGATETGFVKEDECLPDNLSTEKYHNVLVKEAHTLVETYLRTSAPGLRFPWYLMQQVFLYLAARNDFPRNMVEHRARGGSLLSLYWKLAKFMNGQIPEQLEQRSIFLVIARTGFGVSDFDFLSSKERLSEKFLSEVDRMSPSVARDLWWYYRDRANEQLKDTALRLGLESKSSEMDEMSLARISGQARNPFYEEENLIELACWLLKQPATDFSNPVSPWRILCNVEASKPKGYEFGKIDPETFKLKTSGNKATHLFEPPDWCESDEDRQKYQVGLLIRYSLHGSTNFYSNFNTRKMAQELRYTKTISHWEQQRYSGFQGREAFGPPWLPISSFTEDLLFQLLRWPGSGVLDPELSVAELLKRVENRVAHLRKQRGEVTSVTFLEQSAPWPSKYKQPKQRYLRVGIVQSIIPDSTDYDNHRNDPELNDPSIRTRQRSHLAAIMEGVAQMLRVRNTHRWQSENEGRVIDLLIFPELAIHPNDIDPIILPFVRRHRCIVLFGQVYHPRDTQQGAPLINSCLWMIPEWSSARGLQVRRIEQGKQNLTATELNFTPPPIQFRPAQWLVEYQWHSDDETHRPLVLSASVCYDATDLSLAADLRSRSDLYIVCALNRDVGTFDRMSDSLHYHMFQGVIVVNNGQFGGSSFYMPFRNSYERQVLHLHGQPQATIAFAEIDPEKLINRPDERDHDPPDRPDEEDHDLPEGQWKTPPAGWERR